MTKLSRAKLFAIVLEVLLLIGFAVLLFLDKDYKASVAIIIDIMALVAEVLVCKCDKWWSHIVIIIGLIVVDVIWVRGMWLGSGQEQEDTVGEMLAGNTGNVTVQKLTEDRIDFDIKEDPLLKSLDEYTSITGTNQERMQDVITDEIKTWLKSWDSQILGDAGEGYDVKRDKVDEIYTILCIPEAESQYLQDKAVEDYQFCIVEVKGMYDFYKNPELKKEEALRHWEMGNLCQRLGRQSDANAAYLEGIDTAWEGLEESIKYGMSTNAKEILEVLRQCYAGMAVLNDENDAWDRKRADELSEVFGELKESFDSILKEETKKK